MEWCTNILIFHPFFESDIDDHSVLHHRTIAPSHTYSISRRRLGHLPFHLEHHHEHHLENHLEHHHCT